MKNTANIQTKKITETSQNRKIDIAHKNSSLSNFVPVAFHYDENTLLTKNGELIQIIKIRGLNSERVSDKLQFIRSELRKTLNNNSDNSFAFWVHTVRHKIDISDDSEYENFLSSCLNGMWCKKNFWHDKFTNDLYISVVHFGAKLGQLSLGSFFSSFNYNKTWERESSFLSTAAQNLTALSNKIIDDLSGFFPIRLGVYQSEDGIPTSSIIEIYRYIIHLSRESSCAPDADLSEYLTYGCKYTISNDYIEVERDNKSRFASVISINDYTDTPSDVLSDFLVSPVEMVIFEVIRFISPSEVNAYFKRQNYLLSITESSSLSSEKNIADILKDNVNNKRFCKLHASIMLISDSIDNLRKDMAKASSKLSSVGVINVLEDIDLEKVFWSSLPGNFQFINRGFFNSTDLSCIFTSLHNVNLGTLSSKWGKFITILRTQNGTPYFVNFHDKYDNNVVGIFGNKGCGKTTLLNFLLSEAAKFDKTILYITTDNTSNLFIKSQEGQIFDQSNTGNFLAVKQPDLEFIMDFLKIISTDQDSIKDNEESIKKSISNFLKKEESFSFEKFLVYIKRVKTLKTLSDDLQCYRKNEKFYDVFSGESNIEFSNGKFYAFDLSRFDDELYAKENIPREQKLMDQYHNEIKKIKATKAAVTYILQQVFIHSADESSKYVIVFDNIEKLIDLEYFSYLLDKIFENSKHKNVVLILTSEIIAVQKLFSSGFIMDWIKSVGTQFIFPPHVNFANLEKIFNLTAQELNSLKILPPRQRTFLIKQNNSYIGAELSLGNFIGMSRFLSARKEDVSLCEKIRVECGEGNTKQWVDYLYSMLDVR